MKSKLIAALVAGALSCGASQAAVLTLTIIANTANNVGLITSGSGASTATVTGNLYFYTSTTDLTPGTVASVTTRTGFEALLTAPTTLRSNVAFTSGAVTSSASQELGAAGLFTYLWLQSTDGNFIGAYQGANIPGVGAVTINSATITEDLKGTSTYAVANSINSGFQLVAIPEPSAALLGMLGALGLLRRRR